MSRDPPPTRPIIYRPTSTSALTNLSTLSAGQQQLFAGYSSTLSQPSSHSTTVALSSRQFTLHRSNYSLAPLSPENKDGDAELDRDEHASPDTSFQATIQGPPSDAGGYYSSKKQGGQSGGRISRTPSRRSTGATNSSPTPIDPPQSDFDRVQKTQARNLADARPRGAAQSDVQVLFSEQREQAALSNPRTNGSFPRSTREPLKDNKPAPSL
jgi:hypothetical protein